MTKTKIGILRDFKKSIGDPTTHKVVMNIKWGEMIKKGHSWGYHALFIQNVPVAYIAESGNWGYTVYFIDDKDLPSRKGTYYQKLETAMRNCERRFGIYSDRLRNMYRADNSIPK